MHDFGVYRNRLGRFDLLDGDGYRKARKIKELIRSVKQSPYKGIGKSEPLKHEFKGRWSWRITREHRLIYRIMEKRDNGQRSIILQLSL